MRCAGCALKLGSEGKGLPFSYLFQNGLRLPLAAQHRFIMRSTVEENVVALSSSRSQAMDMRLHPGSRKVGAVVIF